LLHELVPQAARIGILADPTTISTRPQLEAAALTLRVELITAQAVNPDEIGVALDHLAGADLGAVNVLASPILDDARAVIIDRLNRDRLPAIYQWPELAELGGLAGYGPRLAGVIRARAASMHTTKRRTSTGLIGGPAAIGTASATAGRSKTMRLPPGLRTLTPRR
jgi:hypothetical protein